MLLTTFLALGCLVFAGIILWAFSKSLAGAGRAFMETPGLAVLMFVAMVVFGLLTDMNRPPTP